MPLGAKTECPLGFSCWATDDLARTTDLATAAELDERTGVS